MSKGQHTELIGKRFGDLIERGAVSLPGGNQDDVGSVAALFAVPCDSANRPSDRANGHMAVSHSGGRDIDRPLWCFGAPRVGCGTSATGLTISPTPSTPTVTTSPS